MNMVAIFFRNANGAASQIHVMEWIDSGIARRICGRTFRSACRRHKIFAFDRVDWNEQEK
jgi:hypothetical protein